MIDKARIEELIERTQDQGLKTRLMMLWNGFVACQKAYMADSTAKNLRDMKASEAELERQTAEAARISGSEMTQKTPKRDKLREPRGKLTDKQERFCQEYLKDLNAAEAAKRAGYKGKTPHDYSNQGAKNMSKVVIARRLTELKAARAHELKIEAQDVLRELWNLARYSQKEFVSWDNRGSITFKTSDELSDEQAKRISSIKQTRSKDGNMTIEMKFFDKIRPLELCGQHIGMFGEGGSAFDPDEMLRMMLDFQAVMDGTVPDPSVPSPPGGKIEPEPIVKAQDPETEDSKKVVH